MFWSTQPATMEKQKRRTKQQLGGPSFKEREGKGSDWRSANRCRQLQTQKKNPRQHANPPPPLCLFYLPAFPRIIIPL